MYNEIDSNKRKSYLLIALFIGLLALVGYIAGELADINGVAGLVIALFVSISWTIISWFGGSKLTLFSVGAQELKDRSQNTELWNLVENLAITAGIPKPRIFIVTDPSPNAFATGRDPQHATVTVTTGLLQLLNRTELEGVLAHEISHIKNYDIRIMLLASVLVGSIVFIGNMIFRFGLFRGRNKNNIIFLILGLLFIFLSPLIGELIRLAISRKREYLADASGALLTRYPEGLASALEKIRQNAKPMKISSITTNHLWISDPTTKSLSDTIEHFWSTHPPIKKRISILRNMM